MSTLCPSFLEGNTLSDQALDNLYARLDKAVDGLVTLKEDVLGAIRLLPEPHRVDMLQAIASGNEAEVAALAVAIAVGAHT